MENKRTQKQIGFYIFAILIYRCAYVTVQFWGTMSQKQIGSGLIGPCIRQHAAQIQFVNYEYY